MDRDMRIQTRIDDAAVTLLVAGTFTAAAVADFERALDEARRLQRPIVLDLSSVSLIDRPTLKYLIDVMEHDLRLVVCPDYVEHWMYRESTRAAANVDNDDNTVAACLQKRVESMTGLQARSRSTPPCEIRRGAPAPCSCEGSVRRGLTRPPGYQRSGSGKNSRARSE